MGERRAGLAIAGVSTALVVAVGVLLLFGGPAREALPAEEASMLPLVNAVLNGTSAGLLAVGYACIRRRNVAAHRACMLGAFGVSTLFLVSYVVYHAQSGSVRFTGQGPIRWVYFVLLVSHIVLAAAVVPLALTTIHRAFGGAFERHRRLARWTLPIWLYVSVTGVLVYWMLYRLFPPR